MEKKIIKWTKFKGDYSVSNQGDMRNDVSGLILSQHMRNGYKSVCISINNKRQTVNIHPIVAEMFLTKIEGHIVNHKNGNKTDNRVENLEWVSRKDNTKHAIASGLSKPHPKSVDQYGPDLKYIATYESILVAAEKTGANDRHISAVCKGKRKTTGGFIWKYTIPEVTVLLDLKIMVQLIQSPNYYAVTEGRIYSSKGKCYLLPKVLPSGYQSVKIPHEGKLTDFYIHQLVASAFIPNPENKKFVNHKDRNHGNNKVENLEWVTHSENMIHYIKNKNII
jgi:hypothetical protein